jgi:S-adenosylmethionine hydrolase
MQERPLVTLTTDFGLGDGFVGAMKGVLATAAPGAVVVDIAHDIAPQDILGGALALAQAAPYFPAGTIHVAVVDPGVGGQRAEVVVAAAGQLFVGPDNGLLSLAARSPRRVFQIAAPGFRAAMVSPTFHGRDVFAVAAARIAAGAPLVEVGPPLADLVPLPIPSPRQAEGGFEGQVIHLDRFGNLLTSLPGPSVVGAAGMWIEAPDGPVDIPLVRTFADVARGAPLAYVGSSGWLEIAVRDGSAADRLRVGRGARVVVVIEDDAGTRTGATTG